MLVLDKAVLDYPVLYSDARVLSIFESLAGEIREEIAGEMRISGQNLQWMKKCMPSFIPNLQQTADYLGMSPRTIQHKLKEEQTTYQTILPTRCITPNRVPSRMHLRNGPVLPRDSIGSNGSGKKAGSRVRKIVFLMK